MTNKALCLTERHLTEYHKVWVNVARALTYGTLLTWLEEVMRKIYPVCLTLCQHVCITATNN